MVARYIGRKREFGTVLKPRIYLDHAATTPMTAAAQAAAADGMARWANPSSPHAEGRAAKAALEDARRRIAAAYGWDGEVLLTSGASEALAIAVGRRTLQTVSRSAVEHDALIRVTEGAEVLPVDHDGIVSDLAASAGLYAVQWANSETGVRQPIAALAETIHAAGGRLLVDAAQMPAGADPTALAAADIVVVSAHKRGGPPGVGALLIREFGSIQPTGGQERGYRAGTENLPGVLGFAAAVEEPEPDHAELRARLDDRLKRSGAIVVGEGSPRHPAIGAYRMPGTSANAQLVRFDLAGFAVSAGSACASGSLKPSHVLTAMGWDDAALREVVRVSFGRGTTVAEVDAFAAEWRAIGRAARAL